MAVFTSVDAAALEAFLAQFDLGRCTGFAGIDAGIENTNYFVSTTTGDYVLTLFERLDAQALPFYLDLLSHLAVRGLPVPAPQRDQRGDCLLTLMGKPAILVNRLAGASVFAPNATQCEEMGARVAQLHLASRDYSGQQPNPRGLSWWREVAPALRPHLPVDQRQLFDEELAAQLQFHASKEYAQLARGAVHADLFRDNVLITGEQITGIIDFYFAGVDTYLFDLAVCVNDWGIDPQKGDWQPELRDALLKGYERLRPLSDLERNCWPLALRAAAFRFWVSRLYDWHLPRPAQTLVPKDPRHFERLLQHRIAQATA